MYLLSSSGNLNFFLDLSKNCGIVHLAPTKKFLVKKRGKHYEEQEVTNDGNYNFIIIINPVVRDFNVDLNTFI